MPTCKVRALRDAHQPREVKMRILSIGELHHVTGSQSNIPYCLPDYAFVVLVKAERRFKGEARGPVSQQALVRYKKEAYPNGCRPIPDGQTIDQMI